MRSRKSCGRRLKPRRRDAFRAMRAKGEETRAKLRVEIDKPGADLKQFAQLRDELGAQMRAQMEAARKQMREAWFAVYDTLDSAQKEKVRVAIRTAWTAWDATTAAGRGPKCTAKAAARIAAPGSPGRAAATSGRFPPGPSGSGGNRTRPRG